MNYFLCKNIVLIPIFHYIQHIPTLLRVYGGYKFDLSDPEKSIHGPNCNPSFSTPLIDLKNHQHIDFQTCLYL